MLASILTLLVGVPLCIFGLALLPGCPTADLMQLLTLLGDMEAQSCIPVQGNRIKNNFA